MVAARRPQEPPFKPGAARRAVLLALALALALAAADPAAAGQAVVNLSGQAPGKTPGRTPGQVVPVRYVYASVIDTPTVSTQCWQTLAPQRQVLQAEHNAKPFLLRNWSSILGAALGGLGGLWLLHNLATAAAFKIWALPVMVGSGLAGYETGPGGPIGAAAGGFLLYNTGLDVGKWIGMGNKTRHLDLGPRNWQPTLIGGLLGAAGGIALWNAIFPPDVPSPLVDDPNGVIEPETFLQQKECGLVRHDRPAASDYRVGYRYDGEEREVTLPYDPGEALRLDAQGNVVGKARLPY